MHHRSHRLRSYAAALVLVATLALGLTPTALGDEWARDRVDIARAVDALDPAIRTAVIAHALEVPGPQTDLPSTPAAGDDTFAWGAAAVGLGVGIGGMCVMFGCVTLLRHDGRLRSV